MKRNKEFATMTRIIDPRSGKAETFAVRVMARAEGYAMVRRKGAIPFVADEKSLTPAPPPPPPVTA